MSNLTPHIAFKSHATQFKFFPINFSASSKQETSLSIQVSVLAIVYLLIGREMSRRQ